MTTLRIAVDARPLALPMSGITRYTHELLLRLVRSPHQWFLYLDKEPLHPLPTLPNLQIRYGSVSSRASSTIFAQTFFPIWSRKDNVDVFWSPRHHLPLLLPARVKKLLTVHDLVWKLYPETMTPFGSLVERTLMPLSLRLAHRIMCVSASTQVEVEKYFPASSKKLSTIYPGISSSETKGQAPISEPYFLFVGTLEPRKNLPRLISAFAQFAINNPHIKLLIVGGKGWGEDLNRLIIEAHIEQQIILLDRVSDQTLTDCYIHATALVMPSLYEGFGLPLLESMRHGVPAISSKLGAMQEVVKDTGLLVDPYAENEIAKAMQEMLDEEQRQKLSKLAKLRASGFCWDKSSEKVLQEIHVCASTP